MREACFFCQLDIDGALHNINAKAHKVLGAHGVRSPIAAFFRLFSIHTLGDLQRFDFHRGNAHGLVDRDGAADTCRKSF